MADPFLSRRQFLKGAAAALAGPTIIPATALGRSGRPAPSSRITLALIGSGPQGRAGLRNASSASGGQVVGVCDVDKAMRDEGLAIANDRGSRACPGYSDFRELLARGDLQAVVIGTPDHWHAVIAVQAAKAGCDIYCEKPMAHSIGEGRAMVNAVRRYGRVLQTGSQQRSEYGGNFRIACELVRSGYIGKVKEIFVNVQGPPGECLLPGQPVPDGLDWEMWLGPAPWHPYNRGIHPFSWRGFRDFGGGGVTDWGAHHFDIAQWGLGMDDSGPTEIYPPDRDHPALTFVYANGVRMYHIGGPGSNRMTPPTPVGNNTLLFVGDKGWVMVNRRSLTTNPASLRSVRLGPGDVHLYRSPGHHRDWMDCIASRQRPICDVEIGHRTSTVCHLGNLAYLLKRPLKWDPVKEEFPGDDEANRFIEPPMRAPWTL